MSILTEQLTINFFQKESIFFIKAYPIFFLRIPVWSCYYFYLFYQQSHDFATFPLSSTSNFFCLTFQFFKLNVIFLIYADFFENLISSLYFAHSNLILIHFFLNLFFPKHFILSFIYFFKVIFFYLTSFKLSFKWGYHHSKFFNLKISCL
jgi:hypothetical protein